MTQQKLYAKCQRSFLSKSFLRIQGNPCLVGLKGKGYNEKCIDPPSHMTPIFSFNSENHINQFSFISIL